MVDASKPARPEDDAAKVGALGATRRGGGVWLEISVAGMVFGLRIRRGRWTTSISWVRFGSMVYPWLVRIGCWGC